MEIGTELAEGDWVQRLGHGTFYIGVSFLLLLHFLFSRVSSNCWAISSIFALPFKRVLKPLFKLLVLLLAHGLNVGHQLNDVWII